MGERRFHKRAVHFRKVVSARMTEEEKSRLQAEADTVGISLNDLIRARCLLDGKGRPVRPCNKQRIHPDIKRLISEVNRIGVNLNQIARALNIAAKHANPVELLAVLATLRAIEQELQELLHAP
jgi:hypothetical protein